jgi:decaprenylphospho-beta-D-ribofuranose 2-oxidase
VKKHITNWGNYPLIEAQINEPAEISSVKKTVENTEILIGRGMGRCYGDSALQKNILSTIKLNHFLSFDESTGILHCESGVSFDEILQIFVPRGWFLPVTPGTKFITVGGAIASDIHGKNHHKEGTFSDHVISFKIISASGEHIYCSREINTELFQLTCGGMGLTGIITDVVFKLKKIETSYIRQESIKAKNLDEVMELFESSESWTYSMAWIDCLSSGDKLGRSILMRGESAKVNELSVAQRKNPLQVHSGEKINIPFYFPSFTLNSFSVRAFNFLYYHKQFKKIKHSIIHYDPFYYPLDAIHHWNRIYGKNGFTQYQFVIPKNAGREGLAEIISFIGKRKMGSFLSVLKLFGKQDENYIRFPMEGYTLAMDFKINPSVWKFLDEMDKLILQFGGRLYLTKDVRMKKDMLIQSYPESENFISKINLLDENHKFRSIQSERIIS